MRRLLKRHFWLVYVVAALACALFARRAANHVFAKEYLAEATRIEAPPPMPIQQRPRLLRSKSGLALADRNIFCSECEPPEPEIEDVLNADGSPVHTALPLRLIATNMATVSEFSIAIVQNSESDVSGAFTSGDRIPGAGEVIGVGKDFVDFRNSRSGRLERIALATDEAQKPRVAAVRPAAPPPPAPPPQPAPQDEAAKMRAELLSDIDAGVKKTGENSYSVSRAVVDKVLSNPMAMRGVRIRPELKDGKVAGFRVARIRPDSALAKFGVTTGDVVHAINGMPMVSADKALEIYTKLREVNNIEVAFTRGNKQMTMRIDIQ